MDKSTIVCLYNGTEDVETFFSSFEMCLRLRKEGARMTYELLTHCNEAVFEFFLARFAADEVMAEEAISFPLIKAALLRKYETKK